MSKFTHLPKDIKEIVFKYFYELVQAEKMYRNIIQIKKIRSLYEEAKIRADLKEDAEVFHHFRFDTPVWKLYTLKFGLWLMDDDVLTYSQ